MSNSKVNTAATNGNEADKVEMRDASTRTSKGKAFEYTAEADIERITGLIATAGIETEMENYNGQHSEADDVTANEIADQRRHYSEADEDVTANEIADQRRHYSEADEDVTVDAKGEAGFEKNFAAAGIETKIENYESIRTQRRHFSDAEFDEVIDVTAEENVSDAEDTTEADEEIAKTEEAGRVEQKKVDDCEGVRSHRKHFPGSTASHIFNKPYVA